MRYKIYCRPSEKAAPQVEIYIDAAKLGPRSERRTGGGGKLGEPLTQSRGMYLRQPAIAVNTRASDGTQRGNGWSVAVRLGARRFGDREHDRFAGQDLVAWVGHFQQYFVRARF